MMSRHRVAGLAGFFALSLWVITPATAQIPDTIYTWDHAVGEVLGGPSVELWHFEFGGNTLTLDNSIDGTLTVSETGMTAGADWAIGESFNRIKESFNGADYGGLDLTGLDFLEIDIGHNGANAVDGQLFIQADPMGFHALGGISVQPGAVQTYSVPLSGLAPMEISAIKQLGVQIFDHAADGNLTWSIDEIRSAGTPDGRRLIANHDDGMNDFDGVITNFEETSVVGHMGGKNNSGLSINVGEGALQWQESAGAAGVALEWGNNNNQYVAEAFSARPMDLRNYPEVEVRLRVQSTVPGEMITVQYYMQVAPFVYMSAPDQQIPADATYHTLRFPLTGIPDRDQVNIHGINFGSHEGTALFRVDYIVYIPEPASGLLLLIGGLAAVFRRALSRS